ncbi:MAG: LysR family transcriptional regulator [Nocardioidaceae bacterium]|nr:LysR family transcriptional regulator [Nocardioidaceae bacterium]
MQDADGRRAGGNAAESLVRGHSFTLVQLRYFAAAAEQTTMTGASRVLMVSQSAVSTSIAQLERELGVQLFVRHHARGLSLTTAGEDFLRELRPFLAHASDLQDAARGVGRSVVGELVVGCFSTLAPFRLPVAVASFESRFPQAHVRVVEGEHAQLQVALREGRCEVAVMYGYDLGDLDHALIDSLRPYVLVPSGHPLAERGSVRLAELTELPMILLDLPHTSNYFVSLFTARGLDQPPVRFRSPGFETVRSMVAHGHGFALLNQRPAHDLTYDGTPVRLLEVEDDVDALDVVVSWPATSRLTRRAQEFITLVSAV